MGFKNPDKFTDIYARNIKVFYPLYKQKLRIEPGVSQFDWLVQNYKESQTEIFGTSTVNTTHGPDTSTTTVDTTNTSNVTNNGTSTSKKSGSDVTDTSGTSETNYVEGKHTSESSPHVGQTTSHGGYTKGWGGSSTVTASTPLSKEYSKAIFDENGNKTEGQIIEPNKSSKEDEQLYEKAYQHMPALDWTTLSGQSQGGNKNYTVDRTTVQTGYVYGDDGKGDITTHNGDKTDPDNTKNQTTGKNTVTYDNQTDDTTHGTSDTSQTGNTKSSTTSNYGNQDVSSNDNHTNRTQDTGRSEDIPTLLSKAANYIEGSSAFMWLKNQLESCFAPWYNYGDDNDDIGGAFL